jgi:hypothetical protein
MEIDAAALHDGGHGTFDAGVDTESPVSKTALATTQ